MQETRRYILDILRGRRQATVDDIVGELQKRRGTITAVTVRHHLKLLQGADLITSSELRRRSSPGRPQYVYTLTDKAREHFANNYQRLAEGLLEELQKHLPPAGVNVILEGVADQMAQEAYIPEGELTDRLNVAVDYLTDRGYEARWEQGADGNWSARVVDQTTIDRLITERTSPAVRDALLKLLDAPTPAAGRRTAREVAA